MTIHLSLGRLAASMLHGLLKGVFSQDASTGSEHVPLSNIVVAGFLCSRPEVFPLCPNSAESWQGSYQRDPETCSRVGCMLLVPNTADSTPPTQLRKAPFLGSSRSTCGLGKTISLRSSESGAWRPWCIHGWKSIKMSIHWHAYLGAAALLYALVQHAIRGMRIIHVHHRAGVWSQDQNPRQRLCQAWLGAGGLKGLSLPRSVQGSALSRESGPWCHLN